MMKRLLLRVLIALNMLVLQLLTGQADLTISGWSYIRYRQDKRSPVKAIDWIFLKLKGQEDHCRKAFEWEMSEALTFFQEHRKYLKPR